MGKAKTATNKSLVDNARVRKLEGKLVKPCWYNGRASGQGAYFAAMVEDKLVMDGAGKPIPFKSCGQLELA